MASQPLMGGADRARQARTTNYNAEVKEAGKLKNYPAQMAAAKKIGNTAQGMAPVYKARDNRMAAINKKFASYGKITG